MSRPPPLLSSPPLLSPLLPAGFGGDKGQAIMMDCLENGDVIMNAFNANDCTGTLAIDRLTERLSV